MGLLRRSRSRKTVRPESRGRKRAGKTKLRKRLPWEIRFLLLAGIYIGIPASILLGCAFAYFNAAIPDPMQLRQKEQAPFVRVLARDGTLLGLRGDGYSYVPIDFLPQHLIDAVVATEDRRFFEHRGVDISGLVRAAITNVRAGRLVQGGSTISQQLAKNLFLGPERTLTRKFAELVLALWLETRLAKRDILELYLNRVYFGAGAYGVEAASRRFFNKPAQSVTLAEGAVLAGLLKAPSRYSPESNPVLARARARTVFSNMVEAGLLDSARGEQAARAPIRFASQSPSRRAAVAYAVDTVLERLPAVLSGQTGDIVVETTIDAPLQRRAQDIVATLMSGDARHLHASQAALVVMDTEGGIRTVVGGRDYAESQFNRAIKARRQPGSAFKPFVYLAALESGLGPESIVHDLPLLGTGWSPRNEGVGYRGAVTLRSALAQSMNAAAARLHLKVGPSRTAAAARRLGIRSELRPDASLALGTSEVTLLELTGAYGVLANGGRALEPYLIRRVRTPGGRILYERKPESAAILVAPAAAATLTDMLSGVVTSGTGRRAALAGHEAAGKTGTSQESRDAWFVGYTAHLVAGVWIGNDDSSPMRNVVGGNLPARLWHDVMTVAHEGAVPRPLPGAGLPAGNRRSAQATGAAMPVLPEERIEPGFFVRALEEPQARRSQIVVR